MISNFAGEFLLHPCALEYSGRTCSHRCVYCFASIRNKSIEAKLKETFNFFTGINKGESCNKRLFREGFAFCLSNRTDPLSDNNVDDTMILADILNNQPNGVWWQTKGGKRQYELLDKLSPKKNCIYITITTKRDDVSKRIEPAAPLASNRIEFAKECAKRGFFVVVAFNPLHEDWSTRDEVLQMVADFKSVGIHNFYVQELHINKNEELALEPWRSAQMPAEFLAKNREDSHGANFAADVAEEIMRDSTNNVFVANMPFGSNLFIEARKSLGRCFPTQFDFINYHIANRKDEYTFEDFYNITCSHSDLKAFCEKDMGNVGSYVFPVARQVWKANPAVQHMRTFKELLRLYWNDYRLNASPQNNSLFDEYASEFDSDGNLVLVKDENFSKE